MKEISEEQDEENGQEDTGELILGREDSDRGLESEEQIIEKEDAEQKNSQNHVGTVSRPSQQNMAIKDGKFSCDQCDYVAGKSSHLNAHRRSKHEGERYNCNESISVMPCSSLGMEV